MLTPGKPLIKEPLQYLLIFPNVLCHPILVKIEERREWNLHGYNVGFVFIELEKKLIDFSKRKNIEKIIILNQGQKKYSQTVSSLSKKKSQVPSQDGRVGKHVLTSSQNHITTKLQNNNPWESPEV